MRTISSIDAKTRFGQLLDAAGRAPVTVARKGRPAAVVMSVEDYQRLRGAAWTRLSETIGAARTQAAGRGLTDELLDELLADGLQADPGRGTAAERLVEPDRHPRREGKRGKTVSESFPGSARGDGSVAWSAWIDPVNSRI